MTQFCYSASLNLPRHAITSEMSPVAQKGSSCHHKLGCEGSDGVGPESDIIANRTITHKLRDVPLCRGLQNCLLKTSDMNKLDTGVFKSLAPSVVVNEF